MKKCIMSIDALIEWTSGPYAYLIPHVGNVILYISTVNELRQMSTPSFPGLLASSGPQVWSLRYQQLRDRQSEPNRIHPTGSTSSVHVSSSNYVPCGFVDKLGVAMSTLSNLKTLHLIMNTSDSSSDYSVEFQLVTEMVSSGVTNLRRLDLDQTPDPIPLDFLKNLRNLRHFRFCGYSKSTPEETIEIFQCLNRLESLEIYATGPNNKGVPCNTHEIIRQIPNLKTFLVSQRGPKPFISVQMLEALHAHKESLRSLSLYWVDAEQQCGPEIALDPTAFEELVGLVSTLPRLEVLNLAFRVLETYGNFDIKPLLPASIVTSRVDFRDYDQYIPTGYASKFYYGS
jgi:hypothetical protein